MESAYQPEAWKDFYVMVGGSIAALTGLLFVATSLHIAEISKTPHFRTRAFSNTFQLVGQFINSSLVLTPQPLLWLGLELAAFNIFLLFFIHVRYHLARARAQVHFEAVRSIPAAFGTLLCIFGGVSLAVQFGGGLYLLAIGTFILIWVVIWNAFTLMIAEYEVPPHSN